MPQADMHQFDPADLDRNGPQDDSPDGESKRRIVFWIAVGILGWGILLAIGDFLANHDYRRPLIILASVLLFIGFWLLMLRSRPSDQTPQSPQSPE